MAQADNVTFKEFRNRYGTEHACREALFRIRLPDGFVCQRCGCREFYPIHSRNTYQCRCCRHQASVTAETVMHRTHLPLTVWFCAIYLCAADKRGISAVQLSRMLEISYDSAWHLLDCIRSAMGQRDTNYMLSDIVELDDGYVGGPSHNGKRGCGTDKPCIVVAVSKTEHAPLLAQMKLVDNICGTTIQETVSRYVVSDTVVECDAHKSYLGLGGVQVRSKKYEINDLKWVHKAISNLKTLLLGAYHGRCTKLQAYLDEFCFRFNRRLTGNQLFLRLTRAVAISVPCCLKSIST